MCKGGCQRDGILRTGTMRDGAETLLSFNVPVNVHQNGKLQTRGKRGVVRHFVDPWRNETPETGENKASSLTLLAMLPLTFAGTREIPRLCGLGRGLERDLE